MNGPLDIHPKVAAASITGALATVLVWALGLAHVQVDPVVAGSLAASLAAFGGWLAPQKSGKPTP
jgi:hypothetical protein